MDDKEKRELIEAAKHWEKLAAWNRRRGLDLSAPGKSVSDRNAEVYLRTAKALRLSAETGVDHCNCHLQPITECPTRRKS